MRRSHPGDTKVSCIGGSAPGWAGGTTYRVEAVRFVEIRGMAVLGGGEAVDGVTATVRPVTR